MNKFLVAWLLNFYSADQKFHNFYLNLHRNYSIDIMILQLKLGWVERLSGFLVHNLGFFFVPAGIGLMNCLGIIADQWIPIVFATVISTFIIIAVTGWVHQLVRSASSKLTHKFAKEAE